MLYNKELVMIGEEFWYNNGNVHEGDRTLMEEIHQSLTTMKPFIQETWSKLGFKEATAIQKKAIPFILEGKDMVAESPTGTGKTLAYLIPLLERVHTDNKNAQAVILAPTRELVMQIQQEVQKFSQGSEIISTALIGGADIKRQLEKLKKHPHIIVGTPGRIVELVKGKKLKMHEVKTIVVDEVDQIIEMNLMNTVKDIVKTTLRDRQLLFFSASITEKVTKVAYDMMDDMELIRISREEIPASQVEHGYIIGEKRDKTDLLRRLFRHEKVRGLVFINDHVNIDELVAKLTYMEIPAKVLHGQAHKTERETVLKNFREGKFPLLLVSDVAARGLDIEGITHVIHFDLPQDPELYMHRSGRTGRMGAVGTVLSLITKYEEGTLLKISKKLNIPVQQKVMIKGKMADMKHFTRKKE